MIMALVLAAAVAEQPQTSKSVVDYQCQLRTSDGKMIKLSGDYSVRVNKAVARGGIKVNVLSSGKKWSFINGSTSGDFRPGPDWFRIMLEFTDPASMDDGKWRVGDAQEYILDLNFPATTKEIRGRLGFATLRDKKDDTPLVWEGLPYPIVAVGPCDLASKKEAAVK
jgi:hypothetical protein